jgi:hypothetical protein
MNGWYDQKPKLLAEIKVTLKLTDRGLTEVYAAV